MRSRGARLVLEEDPVEAAGERRYRGLLWWVNICTWLWGAILWLAYA